MGTILVEIRSEIPPDPATALEGRRLFHATREQWVQFAKEMLRELDPVKKEEVPELLRRIAESCE